MNESITVRPCKVSDAERLAEIYSHYVTHTAVTFEEEVPSAQEFRRRITETVKNYPYYVAQTEGIVVGYAYASCFKPRSSYRFSTEVSIYVDKDRHGEGIGRRLYAALENDLRERGFKNVNVCIAFADPEDEYLVNDSARFHEHMGYSFVGRFHKCAYKFNRWYDMIWMEKMIGEHN